MIFDEPVKWVSWNSEELVHTFGMTYYPDVDMMTRGIIDSYKLDSEGDGKPLCFLASSTTLNNNRMFIVTGNKHCCNVYITIPDYVSEDNWSG